MPQETRSEFGPRRMTLSMAMDIGDIAPSDLSWVDEVHNVPNVLSARTLPCSASMKDATADFLTGTARFTGDTVHQP